MSLKKNLEEKKAQVSLEYFILFSLIAILTILSFSSFLVNVRNSLQGENGFFQTAANMIITDPQVDVAPEAPGAGVTYCTTCYNMLGQTYASNITEYECYSECGITCVCSGPYAGGGG